MWLVKLLLLFGAVYLGLLVVMFFQQTRMLFPTDLAAAAGGPAPPGAEPLDLTTRDGAQLRGIHIAPNQPPAREALLIIGFGGNAWNANHMAAYLHEIFPEANVVAFHYRGYPPSSGQPSAAALLSDAPAIFDRAAASVGSRQVVAVGFSIGAAVAAHLATRRLVTGLILVTPFDSLAALGREHFAWAPVSMILRHHLNPDEYVHGSTTPTAVIAAERDTIVPPRRTEALRRAIPVLVFDRTIADADHNDLYERDEFRAAMTEALAHIRSARRGTADSLM